MIKDFSDDNFIDIVKNSISKKEIVIKLGMVPGGATNKNILKRIKQLNIDISHLCGETITTPIINLVGNIYGSWEVICLSPNNKKGTFWICKCMCGSEFEVDGHDLKMGKSLGCIYCGRVQASEKHKKYNSIEKYCPWCKSYKSLDQYHLNRSKTSRKSAYCISCGNINKHHLSKDDYDIILLKQNYTCAINGCNTVPNNIDHDHNCCSGAHSCGKCIRGIVCNLHNLGMGFFNDNPLLLRAAADYLEQYNKIKSLN